MKLVIFDMDGVIIDSEHIYSEIDEEIYNKFNIELTDKKKKSFVGRNSFDIWSDLHLQFGLKDKISLDDLIIFQNEEYLKGLKIKEVKLVDGIIDWMRWFKENNVEMVIASSSPLAIIKYTIDKFGLNEYIKGYISGDDVVNSKPNPEIFVKAAQMMGLKSNECLVIEDSSNGVKAAKDANIKCVGYINTNSGEQDLSVADLVINKFCKDNFNKIRGLFEEMQ